MFWLKDFLLLDSRSHLWGNLELSISYKNKFSLLFQILLSKVVDNVKQKFGGMD